MRGAALALLLLSMPLAGCGAPPGPPLAPPPPPPLQGTPTEADIAGAARAFRGQEAFGWVQRQVLVPVDCGPAPPPGNAAGCLRPRYRVPGTEGNNATAALLAAAMAGAGWDVSWDNFTATFEGRPVPAHNVVAERRGASERTLYLGAHYDSRPCADKDPDPAKRGMPVLGANDGASGVGVLLALAESLGTRNLTLTLRFVFFDAEDMGDGGAGCGRGTAWAQGSAHYAASLTEEDVRDAMGLVLLDIVGDNHLELRREARSAQAPHRALQDHLWAWAAKLNHTQFLDATGPAILDDHVPFQQRGIAAVDVIHLDDDGRDMFPDTHHTTFDDLAHVSPASLEAVGQTVLAALLAWEAGGPGAGRPST